MNDALRRPTPSQAIADVTGGGETGALMRDLDWSATPLGPREGWPASLRTLVEVMLGSQQPMFVAWGPERIMLYNDGYAELCRDRHPGALGATFAEVWYDIMDDVGPILDRAFAGIPTHMDDIAFQLTRDGRPQEAHFAFSYTPVRGEDGRVEGMFCACTETTRQVLAERQRAADIERQRRMFEQAPGFICTLTGPEHVFDFVNDAHKRLFGDRGYVGKPVREAFPDLAGQGFYELLDRVYATGERHVAHAAPARFKAAPDAPERELFLDFIYAPVRDALGQVTGIFCEGHDVTDRTRAERTLRAKSAKEGFLIALGDATRLMSDPTEIIAATTRALRQWVGAMRVVYADIDDASGVAITEGDWTDGTADHLPSRLAVADFGPALIAALETGETLVVPDVRDHPATKDCLPALRGIGVGALISVPLLKAGRLTANLNVHSREPREWTQDELELAEAVAERTWDVLARARAVAAAAEREHELQTLTDTLPVLISYVDAERRYRFVNRIYESWFSRERAEIIGKPVREVIGEAAYAGVSGYMDRVLSGERLTFEQLMPYAEAGTRHIEVEYVPRRGDGGRVEGFYALVQDISPRKAAEAALRESETRFRNMADNAPVMMWVTDPTGYCTYLNERWYEFTGQSEDHALGFGWLGATHPGDAERTAEAFLVANDARAPFRLEYRLRRADGVYRWAIDAATPRFDADGTFLGYVGSVIDIDERREAEDRLRDSEGHYRSFVELNPQVAWTATPDGQLDHVSRRWLEWTGTTGLGATWAEGLHPDDRTRTFEVWGRSVATGEPYDVEHRVKMVDGTYRWARSRAFPRRDQGGNLVKWYGTTEDIHERRAGEEAQELLINELNHRVKNTLATVQSIAAQTLRNARSTEDAGPAFEGRLLALSKAHDVLTRENWEGAALREIVAQAVAPYAGRGEDRLHVSGPEARLSPRSALALAMALQELATNAVKYGALSNATGEIQITWSLGRAAEATYLHLRWEESGGPPVAPPVRRGFGSRLIERSLAQDLGGEVSIAYEPSGVVCTVDAPLDGA